MVLEPLRPTSLVTTYLALLSLPFGGVLWGVVLPVSIGLPYLLMVLPIQVAIAAASFGRQRRRIHCWMLYVRHAQRASQVALAKPRT